MEDNTSTYTLDDVYTYREAAAIVGNSWQDIQLGTSTGLLTRAKVAGDRHSYVLRVEINAIKGRGRLHSKEAKAILAGVRAEHGVKRDYLSEEMNYGDPVQWYSNPVHAEKAVRNNPSMFLDILSRFLGGKIQITHDGTGAH